MPIFGWDMSHFDAPGVGAAAAEGFHFITHKAGGDVNDVELGAWWAGVRNLPVDQVLLGAYWVLYPGSPAVRADRFLARLDDQCPGWRGRPFLLQVDCEIWNGNHSTLPGRSDIRAFCDRLVERVPTLRPVVYAPKWAYGDSLTGLGYPLWASSYVTGTGTAAALYPGDSSSRWGAYSGQAPAILQFTSSATIAGQSTCDANAYRGTLAELIALVAPGWIKEDDVAVEDVWKADVIANPAQRTDSPRHTPPGTNANTTVGFAVGDMWQLLYNLRDQVGGMSKTLGVLAAKGDDVDEQEIVAGVLAGLDPAKIAAAIPADLAQQVADILAQRLAA